MVTELLQGSVRVSEIPSCIDSFLAGSAYVSAPACPPPLCHEVSAARLGSWWPQGTHRAGSSWPARQASWTDYSEDNSSPTVSSARLNLYDNGACALQNSESTGWSATPFLLANPASLSILGVSSRHWDSHCLASKIQGISLPDSPRHSIPVL